MAKYIKLDDAIEILKSLVLDENSEVECPDECNAMLIGNGGAIDRISAMPTIEVVRCKDCKHWNLQIGNVKGDGLGSCDFHNVNLVTGEGFCYWADKRGDSE